MKKQTKQWLALTAGVSLVVLVAGWFFAVSPERSKISNLRSEKASTLQNNEKLATNLSVLRSEAKSLKAEYAQLQAAKIKIPTTADVPGILRQIPEAATAANVSLKSLAPSQPTPLSADPSVSSIGVALSITGKYFDTEQFLLNLESLDRALVVTNLAFAPDGNGGSVGTSPSISTSVTLDVFTGTVSDPAVAAAGTTTTPTSG